MPRFTEQRQIVLESLRAQALATRARFTIFGARGFIGSRLTAMCRSLELDHTTDENNRAASRGPFVGNLGHVIYCIGLTADYAKHPFQTVDAHVAVLSELLQRASFESIVYLSSTRLYDYAGAGAAGERISLHPQEPRNVFDISKILGEWLCLNAAEGKGRVARIASVYSHDLGGGNFLNTVVKRSALGPAGDIATSPNLERDYVDVDDVCQALLAMALRGRATIYNVASGHNVRNDELIRALQEAGGCELRASGKLLDRGSPVIDIEPARADLGFSPRPLLENIPQLLAFARRQGTT